MARALDYLREVGSVSELRKLAAGTHFQVQPVNAHLHLPPNCSTFSTVAQAMDLADSQDCRVVGASNYYDLSIYTEFATEARRRNVLPLFGLEIICMIEDLRAAGIKVNDPVNPGKMYICGKGVVNFENMSAEAQRLLSEIRRNDAERMSRMTERLSALLTKRGLPTALTADDVIDMVAQRHGVARETICLQERHVAQAIQEHIFARVPAEQRLAKVAAVLGAPTKMRSPDDYVALQNDLRAHLMKAGKPGYVAETFIGFTPAMRLIQELGGFASYPILADANSPLCPFEDPEETLITNLKARQIYAAELITGRNSLATVSAYAKALRAAGILVTAGTEHNTPELIPLMPVCTRNEPLPADVQAIFYEGACVIAAHQFLVAQGEGGYVGRDGTLHSAYATAEDRIAAFASLGQAVIRRYLNSTDARVGREGDAAAFGTPERRANARLVIDTIGPALRGMLANGGAPKVATFDDSPMVMSFVGTDAARTMPAAGPVLAEQIEHCGSYPLHFSPRETCGGDHMIAGLRKAVEGHKADHGCLPRVVLVRGAGLFGIGDDYAAAAKARDVYKDVIARLAATAREGSAAALSDAQRRLMGESVQKQQAEPAGRRGRVAGKIAVVTGAAQGFGLEIAQQFAEEGGTVVLADVNESGAKDAAAGLCKAHGEGRALGLAVDVTRGESVAACLHQVVRMYGGLDVFISNAGVLKAESVKTQSEKDFDFVTAVNYKGYFVCVQNVASILAIQHKVCPGYLSDIIQINSKSGLEGSNRNGAYAGSKFGGIGLTQSFALELIADGIKVNAICPGNYFDGPLWSDPDNGLFAQYLRTGKVPGATTVAEIRKFYEAKVPMGRGCTTADLMKAVFYIMEQTYETGQAVPVTGGQVMLA